MKSKLLKLSMGLVVGGLSACGGGTNTGTVQQSSSIINGKFLDSAVSNLKYTSLTGNGITDVDGGFRCLLSEEISFSIGNLELGRTVCQRIITPQTLAADIVQSQPQTTTSPSGTVISTAATTQVVTPASATDPGVVNRVRLLMTLDVDDNPNNGIQLPDVTEQANINLSSINFQDTNAFDAAAAGVVQQLPSVSNKSVTDAVTAQQHFDSTLQSIPNVTAAPPVTSGQTASVPIGQYYDDTSGAFDEGKLEKEHPEFGDDNNSNSGGEDDENEEFDD